MESALRERVGARPGVGIVVGHLVAGTESRVVHPGTDLQDGPVPTADSIFEVGSIGKVFTATLLAMHVVRGDLGLSDRLQDFLPVRVPRRGRREITLLDLATNTSGLPRIATNMQAADPGNPFADYGIEQLYEFLSEYELPGDIGVTYEYSNLGFQLLGHVLERRSGQSYSDLLAEHITGPLHMDSTGTALTSEHRQRFAVPHDERGTRVARWETGPLPGAGGSFSTVDDLLRFAKANLDGANTPLREALALTHAPRRQVRTNMQIGLAWHVFHPFERDVVWHNGQTGGSHAFIGLDQQNESAAVVLTNVATSIDDVGFHLLDPRLELAPAADRSEARVPIEVLDRYVGTYELAPGVVVRVRRDGAYLTAEATGQGIAAMRAINETEFVVDVVAAQVTFELDDLGAVAGLTLRQRGESRTARKIA